MDFYEYVKHKQLNKTQNAIPIYVCVYVYIGTYAFGICTCIYILMYISI